MPSPLPSSNRHPGFTLVEMLVVMVIIAILAGLILSGAGFAQKKAARDRAKSEIAAMEGALEGYKADNGIYPQEAASNSLDPKKSGKPSDYKAASLVLYRALSGDEDLDRKVDSGRKQYMRISPNMLEPSGGSTTPITALIDPFGNSYGYSTANQENPDKGFNPTFDLWSTSGKSGNPATTDDELQWISNW